MNKMLGTYKIRQVGNSRVITVPKSASVVQDDELKLFQTRSGDLLYQVRQKTNPNPWDIVTFEDLDTWNYNLVSCEEEWFKTNPKLDSPLKPIDEQPESGISSPEMGDVILCDDSNHEFTGKAPKDSKNFFADHALFVVMSKSGFNAAMPMFYGFQIHPVPFEARNMREPGYEAYRDLQHGIDGTLDKMQLEMVVTGGNYTLINRMSAKQLADLRFDLRNIFDMN